MGFKNARLRAGKRVVEVAEHLGMTRAAIYVWENGQGMPTLERAIQLTRFYGCTLDDLVAEDSVTTQESDKTD